MLIVTNLSGQSEPITKFNGYERIEEVNGSLELSFTSFFHAENPGHEMIEEESIIEKDGYHFRIKQLSVNRISKQVRALSVFFDLNGVLREETFGGTNTLDGFLNYVLGGTGWSFINEDVIDSRLIPNFGEGNVITLINQLTATFECEYKVLPGKMILFANQIGPDNEAQYRYGHNVKALSKKVDSTKLRTRIKGVGGDGLTVTYTSPHHTTFGISDAETVYDDRFTIADSLIERIKKDLIDYPEISIELEAIELQQKEIGERIWLIYEPLGIEFQTRILAKTSRIPETKSSVVIGNAVPRNLSDILASTKIDIDKNKKETRSRIEQTNERITLEVERVDESIATLTIQADEIELNVSAIDGRLGNAEASISVQAGQIQQRVSYTDYNGNEIASRINQTATTIVLEASKINLLGITNVANDLYIGNSFQDNTPKSISFRGVGGGARILSPGADHLVVYGMNNLTLESGYMIEMKGHVSFSGATTSGLNYAPAYHDHGSQYTYSEGGQNLQIYMNRSNNTMEFVNGTRRLSVSATVLSS